MPVVCDARDMAAVSLAIIFLANIVCLQESMPVISKTGRGNTVESETESENQPSVCERSELHEVLERCSRLTLKLPDSQNTQQPSDSTDRLLN